MSNYVKREIKAATFTIGLIQMLWAINALYPEHSYTMSYLMSRELSVSWFFMQFLVGASMLVGATCARRKLRHISLFLSALVSASMLLILAKGGLITPVTLALAVFAGMCVVLLVCDAKGKPREKLS